MKNIKRRQRTILIVELITFLLVVMYSLSYAYFSANTTYSNTIGVVTTSFDCLNISFSESNYSNLTGEYPISDNYAINNKTPIEITVTNYCMSGAIDYNLALTTLSNDDNTYMDDSQVRIYVTKKINNNDPTVQIGTDYVCNLEQITEGNDYVLLNNTLTSNNTVNAYDNKTNYTLDYGIINAQDTYVYEVYLWIDYYEGDTTHNGLNDNSTQGKNFDQIINLVVNGVEHGGFYSSGKTFTGNDFENTKIYLFDEENYNKDFELGFTIEDIDYSRFRPGQGDTVVSSIYESSPYPGFVFRMQDSKWYFQVGDGASIKVKLTFEKDAVHKFKIIRHNNDVYYTLNDGLPVFVANLDGLVQTFETPVTFGVGLDPSGNPVAGRFLIGTLTNMYLKFDTNMDSITTSMDDYIENFVNHSMKTVFYNDTKTFDGTVNTILNTNINLFSLENYRKSFIVTYNIDTYVPSNQTASQATLFNAKDETNTTYYPGVMMRRSSNNLLLSFKDDAGNKKEVTLPGSTRRVNIIKKNDDFYYQYDSSEIISTGISYANYNPANCFDIPTTFGGIIKSVNNNQYGYDRFFVGKLSDIKIKLSID